jgi:PAS domain S-box-containing protein
VRKVDQKITEMADLKDPSPFTSTLFDHLQRIQFNLLAYTQTQDAQLLEHLGASQKEFENAVDQFHQLNPRLFPDNSRTQILNTYQPFRQSLEEILPISERQSGRWSDLLANDDQIIFLLENRLRPLIRNSQPMSGQRLDLVNNMENEVRTIPHDLTQYVLTSAPDRAAPQMDKTDERFERFLHMYNSRIVLPAERKSLYQTEALWSENVDLAQQILKLEEAKTIAYEKMAHSSQELQSTITAVLPAVRPEVIEQKKTAILRSITFIILFASATILLGIVSVICSSLWIYRRARARPESSRGAEKKEPLARTTPDAAEPAPPAVASIQISLQGTIIGWKGNAVRLYGYTPDEVVGKSIAMLFESEKEIKQLYAGLKSGQQADFETVHMRKGNQPMSVHMRFRRSSDENGKVNGIDLLVSESPLPVSKAA